MFVAASTRCFAEKSIAEACYLLDDLGFDKVELWLSESRPELSPTQIVADNERFVARLRDATRLAPVAICLDDDVPMNVFQGVSSLAKMLRIAQITIPSAPLGTPFNSEVDRLREVLRIGSEDGVRVSIKIQVGRLTEDPDTAVEFCKAAPGLGITLDPSHLLCGPARKDDCEQVYPHTFHVHLRDSTPESLQVPMGLGQIDYSSLIAQLERFHYNRALCVELIPSMMPEKERLIELRKIRLLIETLL